MATIAGHGTAQDWDLATGEIHAMTAAKAAGDSVTVPLTLGPYEAKVVVVGPLSKAVAGAPEPSFASGEPVADLSGDWKLDLNGKQLTTPIKPWEELGIDHVCGTGYLHRAVHPGHDSQGQACVSGDRRCARLREGDAERKRGGRAVVPAIPLGRDGRSD